MFDDPQLIEEFLQEAREHQQQTEEGLLALEKMTADEAASTVNEIFRAMHSIKGAAGLLGFSNLHDLTHAMETVLGKIRSREVDVTPNVVSTLLDALDVLGHVLADLSREPGLDTAGPRAALEALTKPLPPASATASATEPSATPQHAPPTDPLDERTEAPTPSMASPEPPSPQPSLPAARTETPTPEPPSPQPSRPEASPEPPEPVSPQPSLPDASPEPPSAATSPTRPPSKSSPPTSERAASSPSSANESVRVPVGVLDRLMALAGELVLVRNRQIQHFDERLRKERQLASSVERRLVQQLDLVTSDLQEAVLRTRMQPIGMVFVKLPRLCRDLARKLGKSIDYRSSGDEVEVDKTILECLSDPLVHLVRNACDHGIEMPDERAAAGKLAAGTISLSAYHDAGQIVIRLDDDGGGINTKAVARKALAQGLCRPDELAAMSEQQLCALIFAPGFSTAASVTDVSGRGVGMDVVKTSIEKIGGTIDVRSRLGEGTSFILRVPLTLAIVSSLVIRCRYSLFAIPQVNLEEVVRLHDGEVLERIEYINSQPVFRLRNTLLPLVYLEDVLDHRQGIPIEVLNQRAQLYREDFGSVPDSLTFAVVRVGSMRFGIVVDQAIGSEEIVVKPSHPVLNDLRCFVGCTILGDGSVAMILDVNGVAQHAHLSARFTEQTSRRDGLPQTRELQRDLLFTVDGHDRFLLPLGLIARVVRVQKSSLDAFGSGTTVSLEGENIRVVRLPNHLGTNDYPTDADELILILPRHIKRPLGLLATRIIDVHQSEAPPVAGTYDHPAILGTSVVEDRAALYLDLFALARAEEPSWFTEVDPSVKAEAPKLRMLLIDDVAFFRKTVGRALESMGHEVVVAEDGEDAWQALTRADGAIELVVSDLEMPRLDGFGLIKRIRESADPRINRLPCLALSALHSPEDRARAIALGFDAYELKYDPMSLSAALAELLSQKGVAA